MQFDCKLCKGICCLNPPSVRVYEANKAIELGASLISFKTDEGYYVSVKPDGDMCPFWENGECSIYENRFQACRDFECEAMGENPDTLASIDNISVIIKVFKTSKKEPIDKNGVFWMKKDIEKYGIPVVEEKEFIEIIMARDLLAFGKLVVESLNAHLMTK